MLYVCLKDSVAKPSSASELSTTKITGKADVGFVKDSKRTPTHQKVKATIASIPLSTFPEHNSSESMKSRSEVKELLKDQSVKSAVSIFF